MKELVFLSEIEGEVAGNFNAIHEDNIIHVTGVLDRTAIIERDYHDRVLINKSEILVNPDKVTIIPFLDVYKGRGVMSGKSLRAFYY